MISGVLFILIAWLCVMPLWASILLTIWGALLIVKAFIKVAVAILEEM